MAMFTAQDPKSGQFYEIDAPDAESAAAAMEEMLAGQPGIGMPMKSRNATGMLPDRFYDDQHMQMYNEQPFMEERPTMYPEQHPGYGSPEERRGQPVGARPDVIAGGGGQGMMQGGAAQDAMRPGSLRFDDLIPGGGQSAAGSASPQIGAQQPGSLRFDDIGVSREMQMDQAFNPHQSDNRAAHRPELAEALDRNAYADDDARGFWATIGDGLSMGIGDEISEAEKEQIKKVAAGGNTRWILDPVQSAMPNANTAAGLMKGAGHAGVGGAVAGPVGAMALPVVTTGIGMAARAGVNQSIKRGAKTADAMVRSGGQMPFDPVAAETAGNWARRLSGAAGQATLPQFLPKGP